MIYIQIYLNICTKYAHVMIFRHEHLVLKHCLIIYNLNLQIVSVKNCLCVSICKLFTFTQTMLWCKIMHRT